VTAWRNWVETLINGHWWIGEIQLPLMNAIRLSLSIHWEITIPFDHLWSVKLSEKYTNLYFMWWRINLSKSKQIKNDFSLRKTRSCFWSYYAAFHLRDSTTIPRRKIQTRKSCNVLWIITIITDWKEKVNFSWIFCYSMLIFWCVLDAARA